METYDNPKCQSCYVASLSGSTNEPYKQLPKGKPTGGNPGGDKCIKQHYEIFGLPIDAVARPLRPAATSIEAAPPARLDLVWEEHSARAQKRQAGGGGCKPNTFMFARGTLEGAGSNNLGAMVGPGIAGTLDKSSWAIEGIPYDASLAGIYCIGMPGGVKCISQINKLAARCPNTKIVLSGYSQGAMVARICAAMANEQAKKQVAGLALFGDPFNGASVKGVEKDRVKTWCNTGDGVCKGEFSITVAHMSYAASYGEATRFINGLVKRS